jgi:hypothetical protein
MMKYLVLVLLLIGVIGTVGFVYIAQTPQDFRTKASSSGTVTEGVAPDANAERLSIQQVQTALQENRTVITWNTTRPSISVVEFGLTKDALDSSLVHSKSYVTDHSVTIPTEPNRRYYFRIRVVDREDNEEISTIYNFRT